MYKNVNCNSRKDKQNDEKAESVLHKDGKLMKERFLTKKKMVK